MAAVLWLIQFVLLTLNVLMGVCFVMTTTESCGSVFEFRVGKLTPDHLNGFLSFFLSSIFLSLKLLS